MMLYKLLSQTDRSAFSSHVLSLTTIGPIGAKLRTLGVPVDALGIRSRLLNPMTPLQLASRLRRQRPDIIQTWMYHADLLGGLAAPMIGGVPVVWCVQNGTLHPRLSKRTTIWTARLCAILSQWLPARIIAVAEASRRVHESLGYVSRKFVIVPNSVDTESFRPDPAAAQWLRRELTIPSDSLLIGMVARFDPQKDHETFVRAAGRLSQSRPDVRFVLCGDGISPQNHPLAHWIATTGAPHRFHLLGRRSDVARICAALDIAVLSSSYGEALPNVVAEAMACGVPCVVTDVGDSRMLVAETGRVVPPCDAQALATALEDLIAVGAEQRDRLGRAARHRIETHFSLRDAVARYEAIYRELALSRS